MMWRLIFLGVVIWLVIYFVKRNFGSSNFPKNSTDKHAETETKNHTENDIENEGIENDRIENMVQCKKCAVHLPRSEAFLVDGDFYCSKAHIQKK